ncbi:lactate utilization protein [Breznakiella homolactica]|uniref:Lactate utilization protein n=1 Tax=Breznakiella homolactica TaxID=2798577 RepID=A0A7T8BAM3_9SPIR|nr:lactate utilization protein [Breznakiella homolactica]QQO10849.1 lactate utilization protein [Breznakiella homolactica]
MDNQYRKWFGEKHGHTVVSALRDKGWAAYYAEDLAEAKKILFETCLPKGVSVGLGGSETLSAMDILGVLRNGEYKLYDRYDCDDHFEVCRDSLLADYFITGTNAITEAGELVSLDCSGSRVAAIAYGPRHVIVVAGVNKIVPTLEAAVTRARSIAPMNCRRNGHATPCAETGYCGDCNIPDRMCNQLLITMNAQKFPGKYSIIIVNEDVGF